ncbi:DMT family transporter [Mycoplasma sp. P36-A1]|uniref:DMT family transporter n=1 Tax=Mycoplasma sp. P36-A1 TaxID=3252900 RepID=UPI003C2FBB1F
MKTYQANILLILAAMFWGMGFVATDVTNKYISPVQMQFMRFGIASIICMVLFRNKWLKVSKKSIIYGVLIGVAFFFAMTAQNYGLAQTTVPKNAFITITNVIWVPLIGWVLFKKKPPLHILKGVIVMLIGFFFLVFDIDIFNLSNSLTSLSSQLNLTFGDFLTLICAFGFAAQIILSDIFVKDEDPITLLIFQLLTSTVLSFIFSLIVDGNPLNIPMENLQPTILPIVFMAIFPTIISFGAILVAQQYVSASNTAIICSTESLFATFFAIVLGSTPFSSGLIIGGIIITIGIIWAETGFNFDFSKNRDPEDDVNKSSI